MQPSVTVLEQAGGLAVLAPEAVIVPVPALSVPQIV
jgi:hypothetical protein